MTDLVTDEDGVPRCRWGSSSPEYLRYHDDEWGRPVGDDDRIYEKLCLEGFQSGLSWLTILRKRENFRKAFAGFHPSIVAGFGDDDVARLLGDPGIVRHRAKILATIANARAVVSLHDASASLATLFWRHEPSAPQPPVTMANLAPWTLESKALSGELRKLGFRFVGPTTTYAAMQALGIVNDHLVGCHFRLEAESDRARFSRPS